MIIPKAIAPIRQQLPLIFENHMAEIILHRKAFIYPLQSLRPQLKNLAQAPFHSIMPIVYLHQLVIRKINLSSVQVG